MSQIAEISQMVLAIQNTNSKVDDLSEIIGKVEEILEKVLEDPTQPDFGQAVVLQFSFLETLRKRKCITEDVYVSRSLSKVEAISKKQIPDGEDLQAFLADKRVTILQGKKASSVFSS